MLRVLTFRRARTYALILIALYLAAWIYELSSGTPPVYGDNVPIGGDYIAFHAAGRLVLDGRANMLYDRAVVVAVQDALLNGRVPRFYDAFRNPPFAVLPFVPIALVDLVPGFVIWTFVSLACLGLALSLFLAEFPDLRDRWRGLLVLIFAFAPVFFGLIDGQYATISLLRYVLIFRALRRNRDPQAACWAALGLFKPQLFLLFPLVLLVRRSWSALGVYLLTGVGLAVVSLAIVGSDGLVAWMRILLEPESGQLTVNAWRMASIKSFLEVLLPGQSGFALGLYGVVSAVAVAGVLREWANREIAIVPTWILTCAVAALVDPHLLDYDLTALIPAGIMAAVAVPAVRPWLVVLYLSLVFRVHVPLGDSALQLSTLVIALCAGVCWAHLRPKHRTTQVAKPVFGQA